jgi:uncharacterized protein YuzB (UPF0349 family)
MGDIQLVRVRYNAECLIGRDLFFVHQQTVEFLRSLGFTILEEKISRVDMQVMVERDISEFMAAIFDQRWVCTARKYHFHGEGSRCAPDTFTLGSAIQICIYDKRKELFENQEKQPFKLALMVRNCFGDDWLVNGKPVTRVEFRIRRDVLKDMGIDSVKDLLECEQGLAHYCCHSWFRLVEEEKVKGHTHEQEVALIWQEVQAAFEKWFPGLEGHNKPVERVYSKPLRCSARQLELQALGCLSKAAALTMDVTDDVQQSVLYSIRVIRDNVPRLVQRAVNSVVELGVRAGVVDPYSVHNAFVDPGDCHRLPLYRSRYEKQRRQTADCRRQ